MKPGDHPDFFRLPPPPGRSRESKIVLDAEGRFWNGRELLSRPAMGAAFATWIARHPDDGRYILTNGYDWTYFHVVDVPFFVRSARASADGVRITLSDGTEELLAPSTARLGGAESTFPDAVYVRVKGGSFEARFLPSAQLALEPFLAEGPSGEPVLDVAGERYPIAIGAAQNR